MKNSEIKAMSEQALQDEIMRTMQELQSLRFAHAVSPIENPMQIKKVRKQIAKLKTELHSRTFKQAEDLIKRDKLNQFTVKKVLRENKFYTPLNLAKLKRIIGKNIS